MVVDLNTASRRCLLGAGLTDNEVRKVEQFKRDNTVFHSKEELKKHCDFSRVRYDSVKDQLTAQSLQDSPYSRVIQTRKYRKDHKVAADQDVGHIVAHANGGADHPANYVPMARNYNRSLGSHHDGVLFAHLSDERLKQAVGASRVQTGCSLTFNEAKRMKQQALSNFRELQLYKEGRGCVGGYDETDGSTEAQLCDADYCERLIREWNEKYPK